MSTLREDEIPVIGVQDDIDSFPFRKTHANFKNAHNDLQAQFEAAVAAVTASSEVVNARDYETVLQARLRAHTRAAGNVVITGLDVTEQAVPNMTVQVSAGQALVNGIVNAKTGATNTGTITAPTVKRMDVVVINSDNSISVLTGNDSADAVLPNVAISQRPLAIINLVNGQTSITSADIVPIKDQGCILKTTGEREHWYFKITDAIADMAGIGSKIEVYPGNYYEEILLSNVDNFSIDFGSANLYRISDINRILDFTNCDNFKIVGGFFRGNSKAGTVENIRFDTCTKFGITGIQSLENDGSSATFQDILFDECDNFVATGVATSSTVSVGLTDCNQFSLLFNNFMLNGNPFHSFTSAHQKVIYSGNRITDVEYYFDSSETNLLATKTYNYTGKNITSIDFVFGSITYTETYAMTGNKVSTITVV